MKQGNTKATEKAKPDKKVYVPPPPPDGAKILPPAGMPVVKTFPITDGPPPANMKFPNIDSAPPPTKADPGAGGEENKQEVGQDDAESISSGGFESSAGGDSFAFPLAPSCHLPAVRSPTLEVESEEAPLLESA